MTGVIIPEAFAICVFDPGKATGCAQGIFSTRETVAATLRRAVAKRQVRADVVDGPFEEQAHILATIWNAFKFHCVVELGLSERVVWLVAEDFNLMQMAVDLVPVEVVAALRAVQRVPVTNGLMPDVGGWSDDVLEGQFKRQSASQAKTYATDDRMRLWNVMKVAMEADRRGGTRMLGDHARDATRHLCSGVNKVLDGKW